MERYFLQIRKSNLNLITLLNDGVEPPISPKTYLVVDIDKGGHDVTTKIVTYREMLNLGEISSRSPLLLMLKK